MEDLKGGSSPRSTCFSSGFTPLVDRDDKTESLFRPKPSLVLLLVRTP